MFLYTRGKILFKKGIFPFLFKEIKWYTETFFFLVQAFYNQHWFRLRLIKTGISSSRYQSKYDKFLCLQWILEHLRMSVAYVAGSRSWVFCKELGKLRESYWVDVWALDDLCFRNYFLPLRRARWTHLLCTSVRLVGYCLGRRGRCTVTEPSHSLCRLSPLAGLNEFGGKHVLRCFVRGIIDRTPLNRTELR